jgi:hypothetical protein
MSLLSSTRAICAGCRNIDATSLGYFRVADGRGERAAKRFGMDKPLVDQSPPIRFVNPNSRTYFFGCYPFGGFQVKRKVFKVMMVGGTVIARRNTHFRSQSTDRYARPGQETALFVIEAGQCRTLRM